MSTLLIIKKVSLHLIPDSYIIILLQSITISWVILEGEIFHELSYSQLFKGKIFTNYHRLLGEPIKKLNISGVKFSGIEHNL